MNSPLFQEAQKLRDNGQIDEAIDTYQRARTEALQSNDHLTASESLHMIGVAQYQKKDYEAANKSLFTAQKEFEDQDNEEFTAFVLRDRGLVALKQRNFHGAEMLLKESISILTEVGNAGHLGISYVKLGNVYAERGILNAALSKILQGIEELSKSSDTFFLSSAYFDLAKLCKQKGDTKEALKAAQKSVAILNTIGEKHMFLERKKALDLFIDELKK